MGGTGDVQNSAVASNRWRSYPANFLYSGLWHGGVAGNRGLDGFYWSRTANSSTDARNLVFISEMVYPNNYNDEYYGLAVRCLSLGS
ncbi:hypothetical protein IJG22_03365 [Candidatus Saccharibacteria bacterium]|nr:hypothetical protein [Candidatus Saccharibacteria bacterium]